jgi:hypothetical protein
MKSTSKVIIEEFTTVLYVPARYPETEAVFKEYDEVAGECICCRALFCSIRETADRYGLDLDSLVGDLRKSVNHGGRDKVEENGTRSSLGGDRARTKCAEP